jgi:hypothetical protein
MERGFERNVDTGIGTETERVYKEKNTERYTEKVRHGERERESDSDRETESQKDRGRQRETERQRDRETERQRDRETERQRDRAERQRDRVTERQYRSHHMLMKKTFIQWKGSNHKQSARWQHISRLKASAFCIW